MRESPVTTHQPIAGTAVFLFTDVEGSTALWQRDETAMKAALARQRALIETAVAALRGSVFQVVGDAIYAAFHTVQDALAAAQSSQRALAAETWPAGVGPLRVRMAVHAGSAEFDPSDLRAGEYTSNLTLSRTARLLSAAHGGQVLVSATAVALAGDLPPPGAAMQDLGIYRLRDIAAAEHIFQLNAPGLATNFPPPAAAEGTPGNLPRALTGFVGRERELADLRALLPDARLLTLIGPGGTGKTRLAIELAAGVRDSFPDGVWLVELASLADARLVAQAIASVLHAREQPDRSLLDTLRASLLGKRLLIVLDNCEHLIDACATTAGALLAAAADLRLLATSREPLGIAGETIFRVPSLTLPDDEAPSSARLARQSEAVLLFEERARSVLTTFSVTDENADAVSQICRRLDGIPLALELAASRVRMLSVEQIAARLDDHFRLLTGGSRSALPRQQTLRGLVDWSYNLLSPGEKVLLRRLSVFSGGFAVEAAEAVCADPSGSEDLLDTLGHLVDRSLVQADTAGPLARYRLLEMIRQYGREKLLEAGEAEALHERHLPWYAALAAEADPQLHRADAGTWMDRLEVEQDNLRAALAWALPSAPWVALRLAVDLSEYWSRRGLPAEGVRWLGESLRRTEAAGWPAWAEVEGRQLHVSALICLATMYLEVGANAAGEPIITEAIALCRMIGYDPRLAHALSIAASLYFFSGDYERSRAAAEEAVLVARAREDKDRLALALVTLAWTVVKIDNDRGRTRAIQDELVQLLPSVGDPWVASFTQVWLSPMRLAVGDNVGARQVALQAGAVAERIKDRHVYVLSRAVLCDVALAEGNHVQAISLYQETMAGWRQLGNMGAAARCMECMAFVALKDAAAVSSAAPAAGDPAAAGGHSGGSVNC